MAGYHNDQGYRYELLITGRFIVGVYDGVMAERAVAEKRKAKALLERETANEEKSRKFLILNAWLKDSASMPNSLEVGVITSSTDRITARTVPRPHSS